MTTSATPTTQELQRVQQYLAADPRNPLLLAKAIDLALAVGDTTAARGHANAAMQLSPSDPHVRNRHANVLMAEGQFSEAAGIFSDLLSRHADANVAYNLALARYKQGDMEAALDALLPLAQTASPAAVVLALRALHRCDRHEEAAAIVRDQKGRCSGDAAFLAAASLILLDQEDLGEAAAMAQAALSQDSGNFEALVVTASVALAGRDAARAQDLFRRALQAYPDEVRSLTGLGMAHLIAGQADAAVAPLRKATSLAPGHAESFEALGWAHLMLRQADAAQAAFSSLLTLGEEESAHRGLAVAAALQGKTDLAQASIAKLAADDEAARLARAILSGATPHIALPASRRFRGK